MLRGEIESIIRLKAGGAPHEQGENGPRSLHFQRGWSPRSHTCAASRTVGIKHLTARNGKRVGAISLWGKAKYLSYVRRVGGGAIVPSSCNRVHASAFAVDSLFVVVAVVVVAVA